MDRKPANTSNIFYRYALKQLEPWNNLPHRSVICSNSYKGASGYGDVFFIVPKNNVKICTLPENDLWFSFDTGTWFNKHHTNLPDVCDILTKIVEYETGEDLTESDFKELIDKASKSIGDKRDVEYPLFKNRDTLGSLYIRSDFKTTIQRFFDIEDEIEFDDPSSLSSKLRNKESWFSGEYLSIPYRPIEKYLASRS